MSEIRREPYLVPYIRAAALHGEGFGSLRWSSEQVQAERFKAMTRLYNFNGRTVLDAGCGRADFLDYLVSTKINPARYLGLEAIPTLALAAQQKHHRGCIIIEADFVREAARLSAGVDVITFSGSLNTLRAKTFYSTIRTAFEATTDAVILNHLSSAETAAAPWLAWHRPEDVLAFAKTLSPRIRVKDDYLSGDSTIILWKKL